MLWALYQKQDGVICHIIEAEEAHVRASEWDSRLFGLVEVNSSVKVGDVIRESAFQFKFSNIFSKWWCSQHLLALKLYPDEDDQFKFRIAL